MANERRKDHNTGARLLNQMMAAARMMDAMVKETASMLETQGYRYDEHVGAWVRVRSGRIETVALEY